jgi:hypothetical protein
MISSARLKIAIMSSSESDSEDDFVEVETAVSYINTEARKANPLFGGPSTYNRQVGVYVAFKPYL